MKRWWDKYPERYQSEVDALDSAGIEYIKDEESFNKGKLVLNVKFPVDDELLDLTISYPDTYPFFRPHVAAHKITLPYHHNPLDKELCLLGQRSDQWNTEETAYDLIKSQLPKTLEAGRSNDRMAVAELEIHHAEPISDYIKYEPGTFLLIDGSWLVDPSQQSGILRIAVEPGLSKNKAIQERFRGSLFEVQDRNGKTLVKATTEIIQLFSKRGELIAGHWVRLDKTPEVLDANGFINLLENHLSREAAIVKKRLRSGGEGVIGFLFPEEASWEGETGDGWVFASYHAVKKGKQIRSRVHLIKAERAGHSDIFMRVPELAPLSEKTVAVIGLGCVGAPSLLEFARCGVGELRPLDGDGVSPGNSCRWPLGIPFTGLHKIEALARFINAQYPYTKIGKHYGAKLGNPFANELPELMEYLSGIDLIYDATAELGVQHLLSTYAAELRIPIILVESRPGGWGGLVARITPDTEGCFYCLRHALFDGSIKLPPFKEEEDIQPIGCISPTFTASGFDTATVSLAGVRVAISTLCSSVEGAYPEMDFDVGVLTVRNQSSGQATFPSWQTYKLIKHPECECSSI